MDTPVGQVYQYRPGMPDRRKRTPDAWASAFRWISALIYPLLVICVFVFVAMTDSQKRAALAQQMGQAPAEWGAGIGLKTLLPLLLVGLAIGIGGMVLSKFRARRRSDYNHRTQLLLIVMSVIGLLAFFALQKFNVIL